jgi:glyoxylase-like metal-dependent hydrolase (beta-lactamase superfamily II)/rhodanese-related sulfurtransferase
MAEVKQIDTKTLVAWLSHKKEFTILDIRPAAEREEWFIPESKYFNAYEELKAGNINALDDFVFDPQKPVVTLCARGKLSLFAAELLANKGIETYSLEGGMNAWNSAYDTQEIAFEHFKVIQIRRVAKGCLSYMIGSQNEAIVIDSSLNPTVYKEIADKENWQIKYVTDTHIHADYVSRTLELAKETKATHLFHANAKVSYPFTAIQDQEILKLGNTEIKILFTEGHTFESTSFLVDNKMIATGDTLFTDGIGRPDLKAENAEVILKAKMLYKSLQKILSLNENVLVMPAHVSKSIFIGQPFIVETLKHIKENVTSLNLQETAFVEAIISKLPPTPPNYMTISEINKLGNFEGYQLLDLEAGANRCAIS